MSIGSRTRRSLSPGRLLVLATALAVLVAACGEDTAAEVEDQAEEVAEEAEAVAEDVDTEAVEAEQANLVETLRANGADSFASIVEQVDIAELAGTSEFTVLAPNDEAFLALDSDETAELLSDPTQVEDILRNHIIDSKVDSAAIAATNSVETQFGTSLAVASSDDGTTIGSANVVQADIEIGEGLVHVIDEVLLP